jgi:hypothetical protein
VKISQATCVSAPIILLYGAEGRGKSTLASKFPKPIALLLERGIPAGVTVDAVDGLSSFGAVIDAIRDLYADPRNYTSLIVDTLDSLEPLLLEHVCKKRTPGKILKRLRMARGSSSPTSNGTVSLKVLPRYATSPR